MRRRLHPRVTLGFVLAALAVAGLATSSSSRPLSPGRLLAREGKSCPVSVSSAGAVGSNGRSFGIVISADGRSVAFASSASNLVPGDTNELTDIFVHDRFSGRTSRMTVDSRERQGLGGGSIDPAVSARGRVIAFSTGQKLVSDDTNGLDDVYVRDRRRGTTERVSVRSDGSQALGANSGNPKISANGRFVLFASDGSLVPDDRNSARDMFVHDRRTRKTERVSVRSDGSESTDGATIDTAFSADGRIAVFDSDSPNLVPGDRNDARDVFVHDRKTGVTTRISQTRGGKDGNAESLTPAVSPDGRYVAFESLAGNLVPGDRNRAYDVFLYDRARKVMTNVSVSSRERLANEDSFDPAVGPKGRLVAFESEASNLVHGDHNNHQDIFVRDRATGRTRQISVFNNAGRLSRGGPAGAPSISVLPRRIAVAYHSASRNMTRGDRNRDFDGFVDAYPAVRCVHAR